LLSVVTRYLKVVQWLLINVYEERLDSLQLDTVNKFAA